MKSFHANVCEYLKFQVLHYQWQKNAQISLEAIVHNLTWDPTGTNRLKEILQLIFLLKILSFLVDKVKVFSPVLA